MSKPFKMKKFPGFGNSPVEQEKDSTLKQRFGSFASVDDYMRYIKGRKHYDTHTIAGRVTKVDAPNIKVEDGKTTIIPGSDYGKETHTIAGRVINK